MHLSAKTTAQSLEELDGTFQAIRSANHDGVELNWPDVRRFSGSNAVAVVRDLLDRNRLALSNVELSPLVITDESGLCEAVASLREEMKQVGQLPCDLVSIKTGPRKQQSLDLCVLALNALLPTADELGLTLNLANAYGTRVEQLEDWRIIRLEVQHPRLGALIDCGAFHDAAVNPRDALREIGDLARFVRIEDRIGRRPAPLGQGEMNVPAILEHLHQIGYTGWVALESSAVIPGKPGAI